jgi:hypothetical protein
LRGNVEKRKWPLNNLKAMNAHYEGEANEVKETIEVAYRGGIPEGVRDFLRDDSDVVVARERPLLIVNQEDERFLDRFLKVASCEKLSVQSVKVRRNYGA